MIFFFFILDITCQAMCFDKLYIYSTCLVCRCKINKLWLFGTVDETRLPAGLCSCGHGPSVLSRTF